MRSRLRQASVLVHFHSFSWFTALCASPWFSFMSSGPGLEMSGTHPPNTNIRLPMSVDVCRERGSGSGPMVMGRLHSIETVSRNQRSPSRQPLMPP